MKNASKTVLTVLKIIACVLLAPILCVIVAFDTKTKQQLVDEGALDFSGEGRDKYGN